MFFCFFCPAQTCIGQRLSYIRLLNFRRLNVYFVLHTLLLDNV